MIATTSPSSRTRRTASSSTYPIGSQSRLPSAVRSSIDCWPIPTGGFERTPYRSGSTSSMVTSVPAAARSSSVVQCWPSAGTHCRSSAQIAQTSTCSECSTAQVAQIQKLTVFSPSSDTDATDLTRIAIDVTSVRTFHLTQRV